MLNAACVGIGTHYKPIDNFPIAWLSLRIAGGHLSQKRWLAQNNFIIRGSPAKLPPVISMREP
jgi:hypothetical protein